MCGYCRSEHPRLQPINHPVNAVDWDHVAQQQGYQVLRCPACGSYWGCRYQDDGGTGPDHDWREFGPNPAAIHRHY